MNTLKPGRPFINTVQAYVFQLGNKKEMKDPSVTIITLALKKLRHIFIMTMSN